MFTIFKYFQSMARWPPSGSTTDLKLVQFSTLNTLKVTLYYLITTKIYLVQN